jgi:hypothetical protein
MISSGGTWRNGYPASSVGSWREAGDFSRASMLLVYAIMAVGEAEVPDNV